MILEELRAEIKRAIKLYLKTRPYRTLSASRKENITTIINILRLNDPLTICEKLNTYLDSISILFFSWIPFIDINNFTDCLRDVLNQKKFQEPDILRSLVNEKEQTIIQLQKTNRENAVNIVENNLEKKLDVIIIELNLLKKENYFLYQQLVLFDQKVKKLETENKIFLERAKNAEEALEKQLILQASPSISR